MSACFTLLFVLAACAVPITARPAAPLQAGDAVPIESEVRTAALFKNGLAFVHREASLEGTAGTVRLDELPPPAHGTFWLSADPARVALGPAIARRTERRELQPALTVAQLMRANVGRDLTLMLAEGQSVSGRLVAMPESGPGQEHGAAAARYPSPPDLALIETEGGMTALSAGAVQRVISPSGELARELEVSREAVSLSLSLEPRGDGAASLSILYLERGLTWVPSYAIDISESGRATLTAKAEVINEAEDLADATLQFVTGFPNLQFAHVVDPIAMQGDLDAFLGALGRSPSAGMPVVMQQAVLSNRAMADQVSFPVAGPPAGGTSVEDLFFYEEPGVTLKRGERGLYPLFSVSVPYEDLYQWRIADSLEGSQVRRQDQPEQEEVWHSVRLVNDSSVPWTTAPAMTMKGGRLLGQDTLNYAAVGARTTVRVTRAIDVQGEQTEYELLRERDAASFHGRSYDRVTVRGEVRATNHKRQAVRLEVSKQIQGEVTENPDEAEVVTVAEGLRKVNPTARLTWSVPLEAGAAVEISYVYTLYVRP